MGLKRKKLDASALVPILLRETDLSKLDLNLMQLYLKLPRWRERLLQTMETVRDIRRAVLNGELDADTLDGLDSTAFALAAHTHTSLADIQITGDLDHDGSEIGFFGVTPVVQQGALTAKDGSVVDGVYGVEEQDVIGNNRTRIEELENVLKAYGFIPP